MTGEQGPPCPECYSDRTEHYSDGVECRECGNVWVPERGQRDSMSKRAYLANRLIWLAYKISDRPDHELRAEEAKQVLTKSVRIQVAEEILQGGLIADDFEIQEKDIGPFHYVGGEGFEAWGYHFPSGMVIIEWIPDSVPESEDKIDGFHQSVYHSFEDFRTVCTGEISWGVSP